MLRVWDRKAHVVVASGSDGDMDWEYELPRQVSWRELLVAEVDGRPVGFVQIIDAALEETHYWGDAEAELRAVNIWLGEEADLGRGYGTQIMHLVIDRCFADHAVKAIVIDPLADNVRAHRFYERLGFRSMERRRFGDDDCVVYRLERESWQTNRR
jgi:aminoglycoside 6'-N-acetyltransferase